MGASIDNTGTATQVGAMSLPSHNKIRHSQSLTLTALGGHASSVQIDGYAVPSIFAVTPVQSTKPRKLMDTDFALRARNLHVHATCLLLVTTLCRRPGVFAAHVFSRHACREKIVVSLVASIKPPKLPDTLLTSLDTIFFDLSGPTSSARLAEFGFWAPKCQN